MPDADLLKAEASLSGILAEVEERRRAPILLGVDATLSKLCDKGLAHYAFAHDLLFERCSSLHNLRELASRTAEAHPHFVSTRNGARASALLATAADAKTRKGLLKKCWRSRAAQASIHARAHVALIRFLDVVDDTKQTGSLISGELGPACAELALAPAAPKSLLSLLVDASSKYLVGGRQGRAARGPVLSYNRGRAGVAESLGIKGDASSPRTSRRASKKP